MSGTYQITDEPKPSSLSRFAVNPIWPLFAIMFTCSFYSWSWFVLNGIAMGSPSFKKEMKTVLLGFVGSIVFVFMLFLLVSRGSIEAAHIPYGFILLTVWKLGVSYTLFMQQSRVFSLFEYFNGRPQNGFIGLILGFFFSRYVLGEISSDFLMMVIR